MRSPKYTALTLIFSADAWEVRRNLGMFEEIKKRSITGGASHYFSNNKKKKIYSISKLRREALQGLTKS